MAKQDLSHTLNLPQTDFPMRANLAQREPQIAKIWQEIDLYKTQRATFKGRQKYVLHDGPPYANGEIHLGHALNKVLKDIVVKSKSIQGFDSPYIPGWDCHGLPIEAKVEKTIGRVGDKVSAQEFRDHCRKYAKAQMEIQKTSFERLGVIGDWENPYLTMNPQTEASIIQAVNDLAQKGHIFKQDKPLHWCSDCGGALAEAEVEYQNDYHSRAIDVAFKALDAEKWWSAFGLKKGEQNHKPTHKPIQVVIWTTTPWTIPANQGICLNADLNYSLVETSKAYLVIAEDLVKACLERYSLDGQILAVQKGGVFENLLCQHPFIERHSPVWLGSHVSLENGTGCVHSACAYGLDDFLVGRQYGFEPLQMVDIHGIFTEKAPPFLKGLSVHKSAKLVNEKLHQNQALLSNVDYAHSYPLCWRHKTPLIYRTSSQWFIRMDAKKEQDQNKTTRHKALEAVKQVKWYPQWGQKRMSSMVSNRPDWCISRQRSWGVPIALIVHRKTGAIHPLMPAILNKLMPDMQEKGMDIWFKAKLSDLVDEADCADYEKLDDIMDVWLESGTTHASVLKSHPELHFPADIYLEGSDQHRGWFQSSLLSSVALNEGQAPYKAVLTHGFTVDEKGHKMSKSIGNIITPQSIIDKWGADVLRLWVAQSDSSGDLALSQSVLVSVADSYRRIRNTLRFCLANLHDFNPQKDEVSVDEMLSLDRWALMKGFELQVQLSAKDDSPYNQFQFHRVSQALYDFCNDTLGGVYLDIIKDRQYTLPTQSKARKSAQTALYHLTHLITRLICPILSFTAEEVWQQLRQKDNRLEPSIFLTTLYQLDKGVIEDLNCQDHALEQALDIKVKMGKLFETSRDNKTIRSSLAADVVLYADEDWLKLLKPLADELHFILLSASCILKPLTQHSAKQEGAIELTAGLWAGLTASSHPKCSRCWHHNPSVGQSSEYEDICSRCVGNVKAIVQNQAVLGEVRRFV